MKLIVNNYNKILSIKVVKKHVILTDVIKFKYVTLKHWFFLKMRHFIITMTFIKLTLCLKKNKPVKEQKKTLFIDYIH